VLALKGRARAVANGVRLGRKREGTKGHQEKFRVFSLRNGKEL
jgi:hypothetical protein